MHLNPYGEYAVLMAASLANDWPTDRAGIEQRTRDFGMTMEFPVDPRDHARTREVLDDWLRKEFRAEAAPSGGPAQRGA